GPLGPAEGGARRVLQGAQGAAAAHPQAGPRLAALAFGGHLVPVALARSGPSRILAPVKTTFLEFEQPIAELEQRIEELRFVQDDSAGDISEAIQRLANCPARRGRQSTRL